MHLALLNAIVKIVFIIFITKSYSIYMHDFIEIYKPT